MMIKRRWVLILVSIVGLTAVLSTACQNKEHKEILNPFKADVTVTDVDEQNVSFSQMPLGHVRGESWLYHQLRMQADNITGDFEEICPDVQTQGANRSGWLGGSGESWERGPYYVRGLVALAYTLQDAELMAKAQKWIDAAIESQVESGAFGPYASTPEQIDWWSLMPMISAIEYYYDATYETKEDPRVIPFLEKYFAFQRKYLSNKPLQNWAQARAGDNIDSVYWLYRKNGDPALLNLCKKLYQQTNWDEVYAEDHFSSAYHIVNTHQSFKLLPLMYEVTGEQSYLDRYYEGLQWLYVESGRADGMSNGDEWTGTISATDGTETCAVAERMLSDEIALRITKDATIADHLELLAYNVWPSQLTEQITGQVYFTMQNQVTATLGNHDFTSDGGDRQVYGTPGGYPCCSCNFHMGWPLFVNSMWMATNDGGVAVGAYGPNSVSFTIGANGDEIPVRITQTTDYPFRDSVKFTIHTEQSCTFPIYLRVPSWCAKPELYINGERKELTVSEGYFCVTAKWDSNDQIKLVFPEEIESFYGENNSVYVKRGAVLYTFGIDETITKIDYNPNHWKLTDKYAAVNRMPKEKWNYALYDYDIDKASDFFTITERDISSNMTFAKKNAPVILRGQAVLVKTWSLRHNQVAERVPLSPLGLNDIESSVVDISLIPYGFARLRVTYLPWTGERQVVFKPQKLDANLIKFSGVTVPYAEEETDLEKVKALYPVEIDYKATEDISCGLYMNDALVGTMHFTKGEGTCVSAPVYVDPSKFNLMELRDEHGLLTSLKDVQLSFGEAVDTGIFIEAERAVLSGSAHSNGSYVAGIDAVGSSLYYPKVYIPADEMYTLRVYHTAASGNATHTLIIDNNDVGKLSYSATHKWGVFRDDQYAECVIYLEKGSHSVKILKSASDRNFAEIDRIEFLYRHNP